MTTALSVLAVIAIGCAAFYAVTALLTFRQVMRLLREVATSEESMMTRIHTMKAEEDRIKMKDRLDRDGRWQR